MSCACSVDQRLVMQQYVTTSSMTRPPYSYIALIVMAISSVPGGHMTQRSVATFLNGSRSSVLTLTRRDAMAVTLVDGRTPTATTCCSATALSELTGLQSVTTAVGKGGYSTLHPLCHNMFADGSLLSRARRFRSPSPSSQPFSVDVDQLRQQRTTPHASCLQLPGSFQTPKSNSLSRHYQICHLNSPFESSGTRNRPLLCQQRLWLLSRPAIIKLADNTSSCQ